MATKKAAPSEPEKQTRGTEKVIVWLKPEQAAWLRSKGGISDTVRGLITEAVNMENLAKSVRAPKKKK